MDSVIDRQEQYSRRNCLLLHGIEEESNENTDQRVIEVLWESMGETISIQDIDRTHRLTGKKPNGKSKPVIVKFVRYNTRNLIFKNKKKLKGSRISITENLTAKRMKKLQTAREEHRFKSVWMQNGRIMYWDAASDRVKLYYN